MTAVSLLCNRSLATARRVFYQRNGSLVAKNVQESLICVGYVKCDSRAREMINVRAQIKAD